MTKRHGQASEFSLIAKLNPILRGWANYVRVGVAKKAFTKVSFHMWNVTWSFLKRKYPHIERRALVSRHFLHENGRRWVFHGREGDKVVRLFDIQSVAIRRPPLILDKNPYDPINREYFSKVSQRWVGSSVWDKRKLQLVNKQKGVCPVCHAGLSFEQDVEVHHCLAKQHGGNDRNQNLMLLHKECHKQVTHCKKTGSLWARFVREGVVVIPKDKRDRKSVV